MRGVGSAATTFHGCRGFPKARRDSANYIIRSPAEAPRLAGSANIPAAIPLGPYSRFLSLSPFALPVVNPARTYLRMDTRVPMFPRAGPGEIMNETREPGKRDRMCSTSVRILVSESERNNGNNIGEGERGEGVCYYFRREFPSPSTPKPRFIVTADSFVKKMATRRRSDLATTRVRLLSR